MREDIAEICAQELESGNWKQGVGFLRYSLYTEADRYCCLGVLCEMAVAAGVIEPAKRPAGGAAYTYGALDSYGGDATLPYAVQEWAEIGDADGRISGTATSLAELNDAGRTFAEIAETIRRNSKEL